MRTIIAGSRTVTEYHHVEQAVRDCGWYPSVVISGTARGADKLGEEWARENGVPVERFPADWNKYGKRAGYVRNEWMAEEADSLIVLWDGKSKGTAHMIEIANRYGLDIYIHLVYTPVEQKS